MHSLGQLNLHDLATRINGYLILGVADNKRNKPSVAFCICKMKDCLVHVSEYMWKYYYFIPCRTFGHLNSLFYVSKMICLSLWMVGFWSSDILTIRRDIHLYIAFICTFHVFLQKCWSIYIVKNVIYGRSLQVENLLPLNVGLIINYLQ